MNAKLDRVEFVATENRLPVLLLLEWMQDETAVKGKMLHSIGVHSIGVHSIGGTPVHAKEHASVELARGPRSLLKFTCPFDGSWRCMISLLAPTDGYIYAPSKRNQSAQMTPTRFVVATGTDALLLAVGRGNYGGFVVLSSEGARKELKLD